MKFLTEIFDLFFSSVVSGVELIPQNGLSSKLELMVLLMVFVNPTTNKLMLVAYFVLYISGGAGFQP